MSEEVNPDFVFGINIPVFVPTDEEVEILSESLEDHLVSLIDSDYMTRQEALAYVKFVTQVSNITPFTLDAFLATYRRNMEEREEQASQIITPD